MNDKIREILKEIECYRNEELCLIFLSRKESNALLDYITNLQQENDNMEKIIKQNKYKKRILELEEGCSFLQQENKRLKEKLEEHDETIEKTFNLVAQLTLRIDKAIEYINKKDEWVKNSDYRLLKTEDLLNILQNGSDDNE